MTVAELIAVYRTDANDKAQPYFATDEEVVGWLNEAVDEAAIRGRLLHESTLADVCVIDVTANSSVYPLHPSLYELDHLAFQVAGELDVCRLALVSTEFLDANVRDWRQATGRPEYAVQDDRSLRLVPRPDIDGVLVLEGYRTALEPLLLVDADTASPEIHRAHHRHLVNWALHRGFSIPDTEAFDPSRAAQAEHAFTEYFGIRPDADLRRITREDVPHHVEAFWP